MSGGPSTLQFWLQSPDLLAEMDTSMRCVAVNPAAAEMLGISAASAVGKHAREIFGSVSDKVELFGQQVLDWGNPVRVDFALITPRGEKIFDTVHHPVWSADGRVSGVFVVARDVTEMRAAHRRSERTLKDFVEASSDFFWEWDSEGRLMLLNLRNQDGVRDADHHFLGRKFYDFFAPEESARVQRWHQRLLRNPKPFRDFEVQYRRPNGEIAWYRMSGTPLWDELQGLCGFRGTATDVTEQKRSEEDLIEAREAAVAASEFKSQFLANVSHEIRTPMNAVMGLASLLLESDLRPDHRESIETIKQSADSLLTLINDILDLSKVEAGKLELENLEFGLSELVQGAIELFEHAATAKGLKMSLEFEPGFSGWRYGDPGRVRQVLVNLLSNAVKFSHRGTVRVRVGSVSDEGGADRVRFEVKDEGVGIPRESQERVFQAFSQGDSSTTRRYGGTGLGLSICHHLIGLMGGEIGVTSEDGQGSAFWFVLPLPVRSRVEKAPAPDRVRSLRSGRVLVAEDNPVNQKVVIKMLEKLGCVADAVGNGREAVHALGQFTYDLVLMDCQMPEMDGYEAAWTIRARQTADTARVPIVALTAHAMVGDRERCLAAGMDDYVSKPLDIDKLERTLARWLPEDAAPAVREEPSRDEGGAAQSGLPNAGKAVNQDTIQGLRDLDASMLHELVQLFLSAGSGRVQAIVSAVAKKDMATVEKMSHDLKSSSGILGAVELMGICAGLEALSVEDNPPQKDLVALTRRLQQEYRRVEAELGPLKTAA